MTENENLKRDYLVKYNKGWQDVSEGNGYHHKPDELRSVPRPHTMGGENQPAQAASPDHKAYPKMAD